MLSSAPAHPQDAPTVTFTDREVKDMLKNVDAYTDEEVEEILKLVDEIERRKYIETCQRDLIAFCQHVQKDYIVGTHHKHLGKLLMDIEAGEEDRMLAATVATAYANDPERASKQVTNTIAAGFRPAAMVMVGTILTEFSHKVVTESVGIRNLVTNKLLLETENTDARIRLKALEMLGKQADVGLFAEKSEVTVTHQSTDDLRNKLKKKLHRLILPDEEITDVI
jgi:hypothetical protein